MGTKHHRLPREAYQGRVSASFTLCIADRKKAFADPVVVERFITVLHKVAEKHDSRAIYCFTPEHVHLILLGNSDSSDILRGIEDFKQTTGYWLKRGQLMFQWQPSFYDRVIRARELGQHLRYVLDNPVRRGLVREWRDYRFIGAIGMDLETFLKDVEPD
jgi:REP element-mobilizing transposase RayT